MAYPEIEDACKTNAWEIAERCAFERASQELENLTQTPLETVESALVRLPAEECFDLLLRSMDEFRTQLDNPALWAHPQMVLQRGGQLATAYESFMSRGREESVKFEHALISQRIRDIIVVLCIHGNKKPLLWNSEEVVKCRSGDSF